MIKRSVGNLAGITDLTGLRFGKLLVIKRRGTNGAKAMWLCSCVCGQTVIVRGSSLKSKNTRSCGCLRKTNSGRSNRGRRLAPGEAAVNALLANYRQTAKRRCLDFALSVDEFRRLITGNCHYCGSRPSVTRNPYTNRDGSDVNRARPVSKEWATKSTITYNGIDRKDNAIGYTSRNCLTACSFCNYAKRDRSYSEFNSWLDAVSMFRRSLET